MRIAAHCELAGGIDADVIAEFHGRLAFAFEMKKALCALAVKAFAPSDVFRDATRRPVVLYSAVGTDIGHGRFMGKAGDSNNAKTLLDEKQ